MYLKMKNITVEETLTGWYIASTIVNNQLIKGKGDTEKGAVEMLREMVKKESK